MPSSTAPDAAVTTTAPETAKPRLLSLDALRGITVLAMLLVNNLQLDTDPWFLDHGVWNHSTTVADFVYPWFLFCVGVAIPYSAASAKRRGMGTAATVARILRRGAGLVFFGCLIASAFAKKPVFTLGVLQIIGLAYVLGALLYPLRPKPRAVTAFALLAGYWAAIRFVPVPGIGAGVFEEKRNLLFYLNHAVLGRFHLEDLPTAIPTAALVLLGTLVGDTLRSDRPSLWKRNRLLLFGAVFTAAGFLWSLSLPFNKPVWTPSYILLMAGTASIALAALFTVMDMKGRARWAFPFLVLGSNAIVAYVAPILVKACVFHVVTIPTRSGRVPMYEWLPHLFKASVFGPVGGAWLYTACYIGLTWLALYALYRKRLFLRI